MSISTNSKDNQELFLVSPDNLFAEIIVPLFLPQNYTWSIPKEMQHKAIPGIRVEVALKNKKYTGIIKRLFKEKPKVFEPKPILHVLDDEPLIFERQLKLWNWMSRYYLCTEGDIMQAAIPSNFKLSSESVLIYNDELEEDFNDLEEDLYLVTEALMIKKELRISEVQQILAATQVYPVIKKLIELGICFIWEELKPKYKEKKENFVLLHPNCNSDAALENLLNDWHGAPKQMELLLSFLHLYKSTGEVIQSELLKKSGASLAQLKGLVAKNILIIERRSISRLGDLPKKITINFTLSTAQNKALEQIRSGFQTKNVCLLHGVTSSGKTLIYLKLIEEQILLGKQVLFMLPEIALTAQLIRRIQEHFGGYIGIYHSKFSPNERVEIWEKVKSGDIRIILGARSALFLPFTDLGLIIVDEEHESSYKQQEPAPRYNARDVAIYYSTLFEKSHVLLGSATPSLESYQNCISGKYSLVSLEQRYGDVAMPEIIFENLTKVPKQENKEPTILTPKLLELISLSIDEHKQIILFQNRRGYSPYQICNTCGWVPKCTHCAVSLTYHKGKNKLTCHYCGTQYPVVNTCIACGNHDFSKKKFGTEQIEEMVTELFQNAKTARMDMDSVRGKYSHDALIKLFEQQKIDILVGTQMVVKGLDFEHVNLVGILDADGILSFSNFRVNERAFQLMEQVSGRAGRRDGRGKVLIQVSNLSHPVLEFVKAHDYSSFFNFEIPFRKEFNYPPFSKLIKITFKHKQNYLCEEAANILSLGINGYKLAELIGPSQPSVDRVRNQYIWELLIKAPKNNKVLEQLRKLILQQIIILQSNKRYASVKILPDVDPL